MATGLLAFFIALFASMMLVVPVRAFALRVGMVDLPGPRKVHRTPIPLLGGLAMYAAVVVAVLLAFQGPAREQIAGILSAEFCQQAPQEREALPAQCSRLPQRFPFQPGAGFGGWPGW